MGEKLCQYNIMPPFKTLNEVGRLRAKNHSWRRALIFLDLIFSLRPSQNHTKFGVRKKSSTKYLKIFRVYELPSSRLQKLEIDIGGKRIWFVRHIRKRGGTEFIPHTDVNFSIARLPRRALTWTHHRNISVCHLLLPVKISTLNTNYHSFFVHHLGIFLFSKTSYKN